MAIKNKLIVLLVGMLLLNLTLATAAVTFKLEIPDQANIKAGDTFSIKVLLDVPAGEEIKSAEFILTPNSGATITSAGTASLLPSATLLFGASGTTQPGGGIKYGETTTAGTGVSGNNLLFATLTATADTAGSTIFTFSGLKAKKGVTARTVTSTPATITIQAAGLPACTEVDWSAGAFGTCTFSTGGACGTEGTQTRTVTKTGNCDGDGGKPATTQSCSVSCLNGGTCTSGDCDCLTGFTGALCQIVTNTCVSETDSTFCSRLNKNCGSVTANDNCGTSRTANCGICAGGQTCGADNVCAVVAQTKPEKFVTACQDLKTAGDVPTDSWTPAFVSKLAQKLKDIFS